MIHGDFIIGLPGETHETINRTIAFAKELDVHTIEVSVGHAYPGTEVYDYVAKNGFLVRNRDMVDESGHQLAHITYPGLLADEMLSALHRFYDEYYFRPKAIFPILKEAVFDGRERKRIYKEAKSFLKVRSMRKKLESLPGPSEPPAESEREQMIRDAYDDGSYATIGVRMLEYDAKHRDKAEPVSYRPLMMRS